LKEADLLTLETDASVTVRLSQEVSKHEPEIGHIMLNQLQPEQKVHDGLVSQVDRERSQTQPSRLSKAQE
jgi:hypothetical protein